MSTTLPDAAGRPTTSVSSGEAKNKAKSKAKAKGKRKRKANKGEKTNAKGQKTKSKSKGSTGDANAEARAIDARKKELKAVEWAAEVRQRLALALWRGDVGDAGCPDAKLLCANPPLRSITEEGTFFTSAFFSYPTHLM